MKLSLLVKYFIIAFALLTTIASFARNEINQPVINATSVESLEKSLFAINEALDDQEQEEFNRAVSFLFLELPSRNPNLIPNKQDSSSSKEEAFRRSQPVYRKLEGMTAKQVIAYAKKLHTESFPEKK